MHNPRPLLIGQAPGPNTDAARPLWPQPLSSTGGRMALHMGLTPEQFVSTFDRINLLNEFPGRWKRDDKFPQASARVAASAVRPLLARRKVILVGRNVAEAFGYCSNTLAFLQWERDMAHDFHFAIVPHASGRNRWYNDPENLEKTRAFWKNFLTEINGG